MADSSLKCTPCHPSRVLAPLLDADGRDLLVLAPGFNELAYEPHWAAAEHRELHPELVCGSQSSTTLGPHVSLMGP